MSKVESNFENLAINRIYKDLVQLKAPSHLARWPLINGFNLRVGEFKNHVVFIFINTGNSAMHSSTGMGELPEELFTDCWVTSTELNFKKAVKLVEQTYDVSEKDGVLIVKKTPTGLHIGPNSIFIDQINSLFEKHKRALKMVPLQIFLSHKSIDKPKVRQFKSILQTLGFDPWLDEDKMKAGAELERSLLDGMQNSCAAVFFITPNYKDASYLGAEVTYAITEKRKRPDFAIVALVYEENGQKGAVPTLLSPYVWKEPHNDLEALQHLLEALPVKVSGIDLR